MRTFDIIVEILLIIGALNWGLVGFFDFNLVSALLGVVLSRIVFAIVGLAALYEIIAWRPLHSRLAPHLPAGKVA